MPITNGLGEAAAEGDPNWPRYIRTTDIVGLFELDPEKRVTLPPSVARAAVVQRGDILMTAAGSLGTSYEHVTDETACFAGYLVRFRADPRLAVPRYISYWTRSDHHLTQIDRGAVRSTIDNFSASRFRSMQVPLPPLPEQQRIANFLDGQVARLDQATTATASLIRLADLRFEAWLGDLLDAVPATVPVKAVTSKITSGPRGWADFVAPSGSVFLRIANLSNRGIEIDDRDVQRVAVPDGAERERTRTRAGDVLVSITASLGDVGVVRDDWTRDANVSQHVALLRPRDDCSPDWLAWALQAPRSRNALRSSGYGGTKIGLGLAELANHRLPAVTLEEQRRQADDVRAAFEERVRGTRASSELIALLEERKRALITACITGEFDVSTASDRAGGAALTHLPPAREVLAE